jgi:hypothetical protein
MTIKNTFDIKNVYVRATLSDFYPSSKSKSMMNK